MLGGAKRLLVPTARESRNDCVLGQKDRIVDIDESYNTQSGIFVAVEAQNCHPMLWLTVAIYGN